MDEGFVDGAVAGRDNRRHHGADRLSEYVSGTKKSGAPHHAGQDDAEAPGAVDSFSGRELAPLHLLPKAGEGLARQTGELGDPRELMRCRTLMPHRDTLDGMGESPLLAGWKSCPRCRHELEREERSVHCPNCGLAVYANPAPTASALVLDEEGKVLLARRAQDPAAGLWDLLGGFVDEGEPPLAALKRELREETGLEIEPGEFLGGYPDRYGEDGIFTLNLYWTARVLGGELELDDEIAEVAWFAPDDIPPRGEFAFANTVGALEDWKKLRGSMGSEK